MKSRVARTRRRANKKKVSPTHRNARATCNHPCTELGVPWQEHQVRGAREAMPLALRMCRVSSNLSYWVYGHFAIRSSHAPHALCLKEGPPKRSKLRRSWSSTTRTAATARRAQGNTEYECNFGLLKRRIRVASGNLINPTTVSAWRRLSLACSSGEKSTPVLRRCILVNTASRGPNFRTSLCRKNRGKMSFG